MYTTITAAHAAVIATIFYRFAVVAAANTPNSSVTMHTTINLAVQPLKKVISITGTSNALPATTAAPKRLEILRRLSFGLVPRATPAPIRGYNIQSSSISAIAYEAVGSLISLNQTFGVQPSGPHGAGCFHNSLVFCLSSAS